MLTGAGKLSPEYRAVQIADVGAALRLLSEVYTDARRALAEFVSNSADAFILGGRQGVRRSWRCEIHLGDSDITISDNGPGITRERLLELPTQVTLSTKAGDWQQKGHKAIGLLAFGSFCKGMKIISRAEGERETFEACWTCESLATPEDSPVRVDLARGHPMSSAGTQVVLSGVFEDRLHQLKAPRLVEFLRAEFSPDLRAKRYELIVYEGKTGQEVRPGRYSGVQFPKLSIQTRAGEMIQTDLYLSQKPFLHRVALFVRGKQVIPNLGDQPEFADGPWKSGRVAGEVSCDFLRPTTGRAGVEHGDEWQRFVAALKSAEREIQAELDKIAEEQRSRQAHRLFKEINQALASVLPKLRWDELPKSAGGGGKGEVFQSGDAGVGPSGGRGGASKQGSGSSPRSPHHSRMIDPSRPQRAGGSAATGFNYREVDFEPDCRSLRSRYVPAQSLIEVNSSHPDYVHEREEEGRFKDYLVRLVAKEVTLLNFHDMGEPEVAERMIELETALGRAFG